MKRKTIPGSVFYREDIDRWIGRRRWTDDLGRKLEKSFTCKTETEAWRKLKNLDREILAGVVRSRSEACFGDWTQECMETILKSKVRSSTFALYDGLVRNHLKPLAKVKLSALTVDMVESLWNQKTVTKTRRDGKKTIRYEVPMSRATKHQIHRLVVNILNHAVRRRMLRENIARFAMVLDPKPDRRITAMTSEEANRLLNQVKNEVHQSIFVLQLALGLRIGEVLGIRWEDLDGDILLVQRQIQRDRETGILGEQDLKTHRSRRALVVPKSILTRLNGLKKIGIYVFSTKEGRPLDPRNVQRALYVAARRANLTGISTHVLRHTYASMAVSSGIEINVISDALGHTHLRTTMIYAQSKLDVIRSANSKIAKKLAI